MLISERISRFVYFPRVERCVHNVSTFWVFSQVMRIRYHHVLSISAWFQFKPFADHSIAVFLAIRFLLPTVTVPNWLSGSICAPNKADFLHRRPTQRLSSSNFIWVDDDSNTGCCGFCVLLIHSIGFAALNTSASLVVDSERPFTCRRRFFHTHIFISA